MKWYCLQNEKFENKQEVFTTLVDQVIPAVDVKFKRDSYSRQLFVDSDEEGEHSKTDDEQMGHDKENLLEKK